MKRSVYITLMLLFVQIPHLKGIEFSVKEKSIIYTNAVKVLENYQTIINQMGEYVINDVEKARSSAESLLELFVNRQVLIYNDLDPSHRLSEFYEAETYASNIILWYPDGMSVQLDLGNARVSDIMTHEDNVFSIDILVRKSINGNYLNETMNKNVEELTFRIAFGLENKSLGNFKIVGIRSTSSNYLIDYSQALKEVNSEDFNDEDLAKVQSELKSILRDYTNYLSLIGDPQELPEDKEFYKTSFIDLFQDREARVYNDINPEPLTSLISLNDYLAAFITDYPNGIRNLSINTDSAKFGKIMKIDDGSYYTYVDADKFFSGSFKGRDAFREMFPLIFKISFSSSGKTFTNFRINSVDISSVNFYEANPGSVSEAKPEIIIRPVTRKGFAMSLIGSFGQTQIDDQNITSLSIDKDLHSWKTSPLSGYLTALGVSYYFNDNIAVRSGLEFNKYSEKFSLSGTFQDNTLSRDINAESYYRIIEASYDSLVSINYLTLPILVNYTTGKPGKLGLYGEGGLKISIPVRASYSLAGDYKTSGYYPANPVSIQYLDLTELGFYERKSLDETGEIKMKGFNLAFYSSIGINIPLGYYSSVSIGPEMIIGLSDILSDKKKYVDIFGRTYTHQPTKIKNFGIRISLAYKL
jgi:opacity protein-like surface antigen